MSASGSESGHEAVLQAVAEGRAGRLAEAEGLLHKALDTDPQQAEAWFVQGQLQEMRQQPEQAAQAFVRALELAPLLAEAHAALGRLYLRRARHFQAIEHFREALDHGLGRPELMVAFELDRRKLKTGYGEALRQGGRLGEAREVFIDLLRERPDDPDLLLRLGSTHILLSEPDEAYRCFDQGLGVAPEHLGLGIARIKLLYIEKRYDEAHAAIRLLFDSSGEVFEVAMLFARLCHPGTERDAAIARLEALVHSGRLKKPEVMEASFELGRLYDASKEYDRAFPWFRQGNELKKGGYDPAVATATVSAIIEEYSRERLATAKRSHNTDERPVFIVGMPRSGTSLVEQILSCHPDVHGGGELMKLGQLFREYGIGRLGADVERIRSECRNLLQEDLDAVAGQYLDHIRERASGERYATDKMLNNFYRLGLISLLFPRARIIHCRRDARDTCLSCYFTNFIGHMPFSCDFESLAGCYRDYRRLMAHWKQAIDLPMLEVDYEALVQDQEAETRRMLAFLDLPWDGRCLRFHESRRPTMTASYDQVNRPMYASSAGRWKNYARHVAPLLELVGDDKPH